MITATMYWTTVEAGVAQAEREEQRRRGVEFGERLAVHGHCGSEAGQRGERTVQAREVGKAPVAGEVQDLSVASALEAAGRFGAHLGPACIIARCRSAGIVRC